MNKNQNGFAAVEGIVAIIVIGIISLTGWYVWHAKRSADLAYSKAILNSQNTNPKNVVKKIDGTSSEVKVVTPAQAPEVSSQSTTPQLTFVSTDDWQERTAPDSSYAVKIGQGQTYGSCNKNTSTLMIGMVFLSGSGDYDCSGIKDAVALLSGPSDMVLARVAIGQSDAVWDRPGASSQEVKLIGGDDATRYEYTNTVDGRDFHNIEYSVHHGGKNYIAINHWADNFDNDRYGVSTSYFDTIVQKTWSFR